MSHSPVSLDSSVHARPLLAHSIGNHLLSTNSHAPSLTPHIAHPSLSCVCAAHSERYEAEMQRTRRDLDCRHAASLQALLAWDGREWRMQGHAGTTAVEELAWRIRIASRVRNS